MKDACWLLKAMVKLMERANPGRAIPHEAKLCRKYLPLMREDVEVVRTLSAELVQHAETIIKLGERYLREYEAGRITDPQRVAKHMEFQLAKWVRDVRPIKKRLQRELRWF